MMYHHMEKKRQIMNKRWPNAKPILLGMQDKPDEDILRCNVGAMFVDFVACEMKMDHKWKEKKNHFEVETDKFILIKSKEDHGSSTLAATDYIASTNSSKYDALLPTKLYPVFDHVHLPVGNFTLQKGGGHHNHYGC